MEKIVDTLSTATENLHSGSQTTKRKAALIIVGLIVGSILTALGFYEQIYSSAYSNAKDTVLNEMSLPGGAIHALKSELAGKVFELETANASIKTLDDQLAAASDSLGGEQAEQIQSLEASLAETTKKIGELQTQIDALTNERSSLFDQLASREVKITEIVAEVDKWRKASEDAEAKIVTLQAELKRATDAATGGAIVQETNTKPNGIPVPGKSEQPLDDIETRCAANGEFVEVVEDVPLRTCSGDYVVLADRVTSSAYISVNGAERSRIAPGSSHDFFGGKCKVNVTGLNRGTSNVVTLYVNCS